ncbi:hypothetical protein LCGC14_0719290 [marine sediment metagenome]|uniref:Uncharacterized protein n=2 Tax=root TaxID=1 RepID=A0A831QSV6_9FLAO|nr:hypothetical protein [Pricia sp.]HEA22086.1 hypothetical protein [Pricia antarctica]
MTQIALTAQHIVPSSIQEEAQIALSHYPNLADTPITFKFKKKIKKSTMQAQPIFSSLFRSRKKREYIVLISEKIKISGKEYFTKDVPKNIMVGWLGHELGHIMDYQDRSSLNLAWFGIKYTLSGSYLKEAERAADTYAVSSGMGPYIVETKNFILGNAEIQEKYKARIRKFYLSPEEIMAMVEQQEASSE